MFRLHILLKKKDFKEGHYNGYIQSCDQGDKYENKKWQSKVFITGT